MSLIRYPGSKAKLWRQILNAFPSDIVNSGGGGLYSTKREYIEPFFGSGAIGFKVLGRLGPECRVRLNDIDRGIACLWLAVKDHPEELIRRVREFVPSVEAYSLFKAQDGDGALDVVTAGFQKLALHRISYSGLGAMSGGPLGGKDQENARHPVDCRWNAEASIKAIREYHRAFARFKDLQITNADFSNVLFGADHNSCVYLDPPYVEKGEELYKHAFTDEDHRRLFLLLRDARFQWVLSYDDHPLVWELYGAWATLAPVYVTYTNAVATGKRPKNQELLVTPETPNAGRSVRTVRAAMETTGNVLPKGRPDTPLKMSNSGIYQRVRAVETGVSRDTQGKLDWLARHRPDLLEKVRSREMSVDAAHIAAGRGVRKVSVPVDPERAARTIRQHFTAEQIAKLVAELSTAVEQ